jgi:hypothetical protein
MDLVIVPFSHKSCPVDTCYLATITYDTIGHSPPQGHPHVRHQLQAWGLQTILHLGQTGYQSEGSHCPLLFNNLPECFPELRIFYSYDYNLRKKE